MTYRKKPEHNPDNYLRVILESMDFYNTYARMDVSGLLRRGYEEVRKEKNTTSTQKALVLELLSKYIQLFEDLAILCLMFAGQDIKYEKKPIVKLGKLPYEVYVFIDNQSILKFYSSAKKGLGKKVVSKIYAYKTANQLLKQGIICKNEYFYFKEEINKLFIAAKENLEKIGQLYSSKKNRGKEHYGIMVQIYFKTKHGFKIIHNTETSKLLWTFDEKDIALVSGIATTRSGRKIMKISLFPEFQEDDVKLLYERIQGWSEVIKEIVGAQRRFLKDQNYIVPMIRRLKSEQMIKNGSTKPGRNDLCLCGSGMKYKKCCDV